MKVMVMVKATASSEAGTMPSSELIEAMVQYNEELVKAGIMLGGDGLKPSSQGVRVHFSGNNRTLTDGPFAETKELVAGYWVWNVKSMKEAIEWVKKCPNPMPEDSDIEIRPFFEADDFGEVFTPELREREAAVLAQGLGLSEPRFVDTQSMRIAGTERYFTFETRSDIAKHWEDFLAKLPGIANVRNPGYMYGISTQCDAQGFNYMAGIEVAADSAVPENMQAITLEPRRYAVFEHKQHITSISETIDTIWSKWVVDCGLKIAQAPSFERYTPEFDAKSGLNGIEIWIPLQAND